MNSISNERPALRFGLLSAARVTSYAIAEPAQRVGGVELAAIAARDPSRGLAFAERYGVARVLDDYQALIDDPDVDVIYVATPPVSHLHWTTAALVAGKHVLCEKPSAMNEHETRQMAELAVRYPSQTLFIGYHWRHHPVASMISEAVGSLGSVQHIEAVFTIPEQEKGDFRWDSTLGGGVLLDVGCYPVQWVCHVLGARPTVVSAHMEASPRGDARADVKLTASMERVLPDGSIATATIRSDMSEHSTFSTGLTVVAERGTLWVSNPLSPQSGCEFQVTANGVTRSLDVPLTASFDYQLQSFCGAVHDGARFPTDVADSLQTMQVIDDVYAASGFGHR